MTPRRHRCRARLPRVNRCKSTNANLGQRKFGRPAHPVSFHYRVENRARRLHSEAERPPDVRKTQIRLFERLERGARAHLGSPPSACPRPGAHDPEPTGRPRTARDLEDSDRRGRGESSRRSALAAGGGRRRCDARPSFHFVFTLPPAKRGRVRQEWVGVSPKYSDTRAGDSSVTGTGGDQPRGSEPAVRAERDQLKKRLGRLSAELAQLYSSLSKLDRFRTIIDRAGEAIFITDPETGRFVDVNETPTHSWLCEALCNRF